jgi:hypothetical protein
MVKSKNEPHAMRHTLARYLPLLSMAGLIVIRAGLIAYRERLLAPSGPTLFYLPLLIDTTQQDLILIFFACGLCVFYTVPLQKQSLGAVVLRSSLTAAFLFVIVLVRPFELNGEHYVKSIQSLTTAEHTYYLIDRNNVFTSLYMIIECDPSGLLCHSYGISDKISVRSDSCSPDQGHLNHDATTNTLTLTVGVQTYVVDPADDIYRYFRICKTHSYRS